MDGLFTRNYESDADVNAPMLAKVSVSAGVYLWLHSRVFACHNEIHLSIAFLAKKLGVSRNAVSNAVNRLEDAGLIARASRAGVGGGTVFRLTNVTGCSPKRKESGGFKRNATSASNAIDSCHDKDRDFITHKDKAGEMSVETEGLDQQLFSATSARRGVSNGGSGESVTARRSGRFSRFDGVF